MKKPSKKQDVFRASQKSFFLRSWSALGQCPMAVFIFFSFFFIFGRKWLPEWSGKIGRKLSFQSPGPPKNAQKTHPRRNLDFSLILVAVLVIFSRFLTILDLFRAPFWRYFHDFNSQNQPFGTKTVQRRIRDATLIRVAISIVLILFQFLAAPASPMFADFVLSITLLQVTGVPGVRRCRSASTIMIF